LEPGDEVIVTEFGFIMHRIYASLCQAKVVLAKERSFKASVDEILKKITSKTFYNTYKHLSSIMITRRNKLYLIGFGIVGIIFIVRFLS